MKNCLVLLCSVFVANILMATSVNTDPPYDSMLDKVYKAEFISETTSDLLKINLANVYSNSFDVVERADLHRDAEDKYYYVAYGLKNKKPVMEQISVADEWAFEQFYPSRADLGIADDAVVDDCHCAWFICKVGGQGRKCGLGGEGLPCTPSPFCTIDAKPIDNN